MAAQDLKIADTSPTPEPRRNLPAPTIPQPPALTATPDAFALLKALKRRWFLAGMLGILMAGMASAAAFALLPARFTAFALLQVYSKPNPLMAVGNSREEFLVVMKTMAGRLKSRDVLMRTLSQDQVRHLSIIKKHPDTMSTLTWLEEYLKIEIQENSELLTVNLTGDEPDDLRIIVNNMVKIVHDHRRQRRQTPQQGPA